MLYSSFAYMQFGDFTDDSKASSRTVSKASSPTNSGTIPHGGAKIKKSKKKSKPTIVGWGSFSVLPKE